MGRRNPKPKIAKKKYTTLEMEVILMYHFQYNKKIIVPNVSWGISHNKKCLHEVDLLVLSNSNYATEIEIKISKADLLKDKDKSHGHEHELIKTLYYAVPYYLKEVALTEIPERAGLLIIDGHGCVNEVKNPTNRKNVVKWSDELRSKLTRLGTMRIFNLKKNILKYKDQK